MNTIPDREFCKRYNAVSCVLRELSKEIEEGIPKEEAISYDDLEKRFSVEDLKIIKSAGGTKRVLSVWLGRIFHCGLRSFWTK